MPYGGPPEDDLGPTQGLAGGPGPSPRGVDDGTRPIPPDEPAAQLPPAEAQEDAERVAERSGSDAEPGRPAQQGAAGPARDG